MLRCNDAVTTLNGMMSNSTKPLTKRDIPALVQKIIKTLPTDGGSSAQQGEGQGGQFNNNIANTSFELTSVMHKQALPQ